jgi:hypothetical protein
MDAAKPARLGTSAEHRPSHVAFILLIAEENADN